MDADADLTKQVQRYQKVFVKNESDLDGMATFLKDLLLLKVDNKSTDSEDIKINAILSVVGKFIIEGVNIDQESPDGSDQYSTENMTKAATQVNDFIFSVLFENSVSAETKFKECDDRIGAALIASSLLKTVSNIAKRLSELEFSANFMQNSRDYELKACNILADNYNKDRKTAFDKLIQPLEKPFSSITVWKLAQQNDLKTFMGQRCLQTKLNMIWRGGMATFTPWWQIVLALFLPFLVTTITFTTIELPDTSNDTSKRKGKIGILGTLYKLYTAPISVFTTNTISYLLFLGLFSYFVLVELEARVTTVEYVLWGWSFTMLSEELRQLFTSQERTPVKRIRCWYVSHWNKYDLATFLVGMSSVLVRFTVKGNGGSFVYVRYLYSITLTMFYIRLLRLFLVERIMGPKIIMLGRMMIDVLVFVRILLIFVISFGMMYTAILFPNTRPSFLLLKRIFYVPYWQIFGETFLDVFDGDEVNCTQQNNVADDDMRCPEKHFLAFIFGAAYMFLSNIILVNLLISMFSVTFQNVHERSEKVWILHLYSIVRDYSERPVIPFPFIILAHMFRIVRWCQKYVSHLKRDHIMHG